MKTKVDYIFSKNTKIGSRLISWGTKHLANDKTRIPSHGAILINNRWVLESTLETGVRVLTYKKWLEINQELYKIPSDITDYTIIKNSYKQLKNKKYDWLAVIYLTFFVLLNKYFKVDIPKQNKWQSKNNYFCLEVKGKLTNKDYSMITPVELAEILEETYVNK